MNKKIYYLTFNMFFLSLLSNLAHPVTPELVIRLNMSSFMFGLAFATMSVANLVMSPIWGSLSDKFKTRKFFLSVPLLGQVIGQIGFGYSTTGLSILFFRALTGACASSAFVVGTAYIIDETDEENRSKAISFYTAITGFAASSGYLLGGYIGRNDYHLAFIYQAVGILIHAILTYIFLPDSDVKSKPASKTKKLTFKENFTNLKYYMGSTIGILLTIVLLTSFSRIAYTTGVNYYLKKYLSLTPLQVGYYMAFTGLLGMIANVYFTPRISRKYGEKKSLLVILITTGITLLVLSMIKDLISIQALIILVIFIFVLSMYRPLLSTLVSKMSENEHGKIMGLQGSFNSIGMVCGSLFAGSLLDIYPKLTFIIAGVVFMIAFGLMLTSKAIRHAKNI